MSEKSVYSKIFKNSFFNLMGRFYFILFAFLFTPYLVDKIGVVDYGIYALLAALNSYMALVGLQALCAFITKMVPEFNKNNDETGLSKLYTIGLSLSILAFLLILALGYPIANLLLQLFKIPADLTDKAFFVFAFGLGIIAVNLFFTLFTSFLLGLQRMDITNGIMIGVSIIQVIFAVIALEKGYGLKGVVVIEFAAMTLKAILMGCFTLTRLPDIKYKFSYFDKTLFKRMVKYNFFIYVAHISSFINFQLDNILLANFINLPAVTNYQLGNKVCFAARSFPDSILNTILPASAEVNVSHGREEVYKIYYNLSRWMAFLCLPLFIFLAITSLRIMGTWMGPGFDKSAGVLSILSLGYMTNIMFGVASPIVHSLERPDLEARQTSILALLNVILSLTLIKYIGFWGAPLGTTLAMFVAATYFVFITHNYLKKQSSHYFRDVLLTRLGPALTAIIPVLVLEGWLFQFHTYPSRLTNFAILTLEGILYGLTYLGVMQLRNEWNQKEKEQLKQLKQKYLKNNKSKPVNQ
ncbi:MAG: flippase [Vulcanimicrobiota bacterium]